MWSNILAYRPTRADWIFTAKTFVAGILALFIALYFNLDRPVWSMATVYIVANPLSGVLASKAVYRLVGTFIGAVFAVILIPNLDSAPILSALGMSLWVAGCLYLCRMDRTPRSYLFMLAGYTAAIVGFPCVGNPAAVFDTGVARFQEIALGIICATLVSHIILPRHIGPVLAARIEGCMRDVRDLARLSFAGATDADELHRDRAKLAADIGEIHGLAVHVGYERSGLRGMTRPLQALQNAIAALLPSFYAVHDRVSALRATDAGIPDDLAAVLNEIDAWIATPGPDAGDPDYIGHLHRKIANVAKRYHSDGNWRDLLVINLCARLHRLVDFYHDTQMLWAGIRNGQPGQEELDRWRDSRMEASLHVDRGLAVRSAVAAALATMLVCGFWIATGWPSGSSAAMMAAVGTSIMSFMDDPVPAIKGFVCYTLLAVVVSIFYAFAVLPAIDGFPLLVAVFAPYFLVLGLLITSPKTYGFGLAMLVNTVMLLNISTRYSANLATSLSGAVAMMSGFGAAAVMTALVRSLSPDASISRMLKANWHDIASVARGHTVLTRMALLRRLLDRQGLILPRLAGAPEHKDRLLRAMPEVSIAANLMDLRGLRGQVDGPTRQKIDRLLEQMATHFEKRSRDFDRLPDREMTDMVDGLLRDFATDGTGALGRRLVVSLVALRRVLCRDGAPELRKTVPGFVETGPACNDRAPALTQIVARLPAGGGG